MKKGATMVLIGLTLTFLGFLCGMLAGRYSNQNNVTVQQAVVASPVDASTDETHCVESVDLININTASQALLDTLPGIGPVLAQRICDYRAEHGDFQEISQLTEVEGIGTDKLMAIYDLVTVED